MTPEEDFLITVTDLRPIYCPAGWRWWFPKYDLDLRDFLANGIMASVLLATGDFLAENAVARIQERRANG